MNLAAKYRPKRFEDVVGQDSVIKTLCLALDNNRLSNAYIFSGLRGSGKTSVARIFAKSLVCENGPSSNPCDSCVNCSSANDNKHMDIIEMDAASSRKIDDIRDLIEHTKYKPSLAKFKVFIVDEIHMLTKEAFNALLKTLEEPPEYVKFILATTDPLKVPATILSRTQHFRYKNIDHNSIISRLEYILGIEKISYEKDAISILARSGSGSLRDTLTLLDQAIVYTKSNITNDKVVDMLGLVNPLLLEELIETILKKDTDKLISLIKTLEEYDPESVIDEIIIYLKNKIFSLDLNFSVLIIDRFFRILSDSKSLFNINADPTFTMTLTFLKMVEALKLKDIDELIANFEEKTPKRELDLDKKEEKEDFVKKEEKKILSSKLNLFDEFLEKLYYRSAELGDCIKNNINFVSFNDNNLLLASKALGKDRELLRSRYSVIKNLLQEVFGLDINIKVNQINDVKDKNEIAKKDNIKDFEKEEDMNSQVSCSTPMLNEDSPNPDEMLESDILQKAKELFDPKEIIVQRKN